MPNPNLPHPGTMVLVKSGDHLVKRLLNGYYDYGSGPVAGFFKTEPGDYDGIVQLDELAWADGTPVVAGVGHYEKVVTVRSARERAAC